MKSLRDHWRLWLAIIAGWMLFGLAYTFHYYFFALHYNEIFKQPPGLKEMMAWELPYWLLWAVLSPPVFMLARRFRLERGRLLLSTLVHVIACVTFALAHRAAYLLIGWALHVAVYRELAQLTEVYNRNFLFNLPNGFMCYATALLAGYVVTYQRHYHEEELKSSRLKTQIEQTLLQMERAQLQSLKMQLHPHFLCNALQCVSAVVHEDADAADEMLDRIGCFLRLTLKHSNEQEVTLGKEIEHIGCFIEIQQARFRDRLTVECDIEPEVLSALVPSLILLPIVENAFEHGIAARAESGAVKISARRRGGRLRLEVEDDGPGFNADLIAEDGGEQGLGLKNTRERLEHLYGKEQCLVLSDAPGGGLLVTLEVPFMVLGDAPVSETVRPEGQIAIS